MSTVDTSTLNPNQTVTIGSGSLLLSNLPAASARLALVFEQIDRVNTNTRRRWDRSMQRFDCSARGRSDA